MRIFLRLAGVFALAFGTSASAQLSPPRDTQDPPRFQSGVELIQLDVSVLDRDRRPVTGLTAADFTILENGVARPVRAFVPIQLPARRGVAERDGSAAQSSDVATNAAGTEYGRLVIILMDRTIPPGEPTLTARRVAIAAIEGLGPQDLAAVATTGPGIPQSPTADRARLVAAVTRGDPSTGLSKEQEAIVGKDDPLSDGRCLCGLCVLEAVTRISDAIEQLPRRRKVLFFIGRSVIFQVGPRAPSADIGCSRRVTDAQRALFDSLARSNVTIHSFDPQGLVNVGAYARAGSPGGKPGVDAPAVRRQQLLSDTADHLRDQGSLAVLADRTGGRTVLNTNAPESEVPHVLDESSSYYLLAFEPGAAGRDIAPRSIDVKVARRGVTVVSRRQHVMPAAAAAPTVGAAALRPSLEDALAGVLPAAARPLSSRAAAFAGAGDRALLSVTVDVGSFAAAGRAVPLEVAALAVDQQGRQVAFARQTTTVELPSSPSARDATIDVRTHIEVPPGDYELRVAVSDPAASATASVFSQVTVPEFQRAPLSLSDVSLEMRRAAMQQQTAGGLVWYATTRRTFLPGEDVRAFVQIYQGTGRTDAIAPVTVRAQLRDGTGRIVREQSGVLADAAFRDRRTDVTLDIERLPAGEYILSIEASSGPHQGSRTIAFAVQQTP